MIQCSICSKHFANKRSLSSHKHCYHKNNSSTKEKTNTVIMNSFEKVNSENYDTMPNTDEDTGKETDLTSMCFTVFHERNKRNYFKLQICYSDLSNPAFSIFTIISLD